MSAPGRAQPASSEAPDPTAGVPLAQSLFDQARQLMEAGDFAKACPLLAESYRLDQGGGTLLNLAVCYERDDRLASAYVAYNEALSQALRDKRDDRKQIAAEALEKLAPRLSKITIDVSPGARQLGVEVRLDGQVVSQAAWGTPTAVDGGSHRVEASAPGHFDFVETLVLQPASDRRMVVVPPLPARPSETPVLPPLFSPPPPADSRPRCPPGASLRDGMCVQPPKYRALIATSMVFGGVGVLTGIGTGIAAMALSSKLDESCTADGLCPPEADADVSAYDTVATTSTVAFIAGGALIGFGAVLWITHPTEATPPLVGVLEPRPGGAVVELTARF
jgi:hypothetical protein